MTSIVNNDKPPNNSEVKYSRKLLPKSDIVTFILAPRFYEDERICIALRATYIG